MSSRDMFQEIPPLLITIENDLNNWIDTIFPDADEIYAALTSHN